jgi:NAD(P)-dependent dehydrogenase (short-subunit alcohol dehydrogenase family)
MRLAATVRTGSAVINTASVQAYHPSPAILDYATTKGAIVTFTKGLAQRTLVVAFLLERQKGAVR